MPVSSRRSGSRQSRSHSTSTISFRSSRSSPYRNATQQTSDAGNRSPRRRRSSSPTRTTSPPGHPTPRKRFGLNVPTSNQPRFIGKFDFEEKYPEDAINEEMGPNARVWRAFLDECEVFDADMVTEARDGLDLLLVFAGLFSAVLTTFVAQTSQSLSTDFLAISCSLLVEMIKLQRAQINGTPIDDIMPGDMTAGPSRFDVWVNALWFTSLTLSLGTALVAVLVKQWLYQYMSMISGTARDHSLIRHYRFEGMQKWHVLTIIGTLPIVLHIALGLFLAGLVVFLIPLNIPLASLVGFITVSIYTMYVVSNILPLVYTHCPYRTPFSDILNTVTRPMRTLPLLARARMRKLFLSLNSKVTSRESPPQPFRTLKEVERIAATDDKVAENNACSALSWLYQMTSNPPTKRVIMESLGCLSANVSKKLDQADVMQSLREIKHYHWGTERHVHISIMPGLERRAERLFRASGSRRPLHQEHWKLDPSTLDLPYQTVAALLTHSPNIVVDMESQTWNHDDFLVYLIRQHLLDNGHIRLPSILWARLISFAYTNGVPQLPVIEDDMFLLSLCKLALANFSMAALEVVPFPGPVTITDRAVPLFQFVVDLLVAQLGNDSADSLDSEPVTKLFFIHDYAVSCLPSAGLGSNRHTDIVISIVGTAWRHIREVVDLSENDAHVICQRAENVVLRNLAAFEDGWSNSGRTSLYCYTAIIHTYRNLCHSHAAHPKFLQRIFSDLCLSIRTTYIPFLLHTSNTLQNIFNQHTNVSVYCALFCTSPFLSTRTLTELSVMRDILYPVVTVFLFRFAGGVDVPREAPLRYIEDLSADPQCLYTLCRVLALGHPNYLDSQKHLKAHLLHLVRLHPTHVVWAQRAHYMGMEPRDWPYLRLVDEELGDEEKITDVKEAMKIGLAILDEFFASLDHRLSIAGKGHHSTQRGISHWKRLRSFVSETRHFRPVPPGPDVADMELGLNAGLCHVGDTPYTPQVRGRCWLRHTYILNCGTRRLLSSP